MPFKLCESAIEKSFFVTQSTLDYYDESIKVFGLKGFKEDKIECETKNEGRAVWNVKKCEIVWSKYLGKREWGYANQECNKIGMRLPTTDEIWEIYKKDMKKIWIEDSYRYWSSKPYPRAIDGWENKYDRYFSFSSYDGGIEVERSDLYRNVRCHRY